MKPFLTAKAVQDIQSGSVFLGLLYCVAFLIELPFLWHRLGPLPGLTADGKLILAAVLAVVAVQLFLNWLVVLLVKVPLVLATALFLIGWAIYITAPAIMTFLAVIPDLAGAAQLWATAVTNFAQFLIVAAGLLWWAARRLASLDQVAIGTFLLGTACFAFFSGIRGAGPAVVFLTVWLVAYLRVHPVAHWADIRRVIQVMASLAWSGSFAGDLAALRAIPTASPVWLGPTGTAASLVPGWGIWGYQAALWIAGMLIIWMPHRLWQWLPDSVRTPVAAPVRRAAALLLPWLNN